MKYFKMARNLMEGFLNQNRDIDPFLFNKGDVYQFSENTYHEIKKRPNSFKKAFFKEAFLQNERKEDLKKNIYYSLKSYLHDPIPSNTLQELYLFLDTNKKVQLEYLGRDIKLNSYSKELKKIDNHIFCFDILKGSRNYFWKIHLDEDRFKKIKFEDSFSHLKNWFKDENATIILSLGGGGLRAHAIPTVLKIFDFLDIRKNIDELWGCSGGSIIGGYYAYGIPPLFIEKICFDFYNERHEDFVIKGNMFDSFKTFTKQIKGKKLNEFIGIVELQKTLQLAFENEKERIEKKENIKLNHIPFFALVSTPFQKEMMALTEGKWISPECQKFLKEAEPFESICASSSIPLIMKPIVKNCSEGKYTFFDGALSEEIPLVLPFKKFMAEKKNKPNKKKLKIFYINLNSRLRESKAISHFFTKRNLTFIYKKLLLVDKSLDNKIERTLEDLKSNPDVDILGLDLVLNKNAFLNTQEIPYIIRNGRDHFLNELLKLEKNLKSRS